MDATGTTSTGFAAPAQPAGSSCSHKEPLSNSHGSSSGSAALLATDGSCCSNPAATGPVATAVLLGLCPSGPRAADCGKACRVCGDASLGHNFGVITCESCKAFFRRTASKEKAWKCDFAGSCPISVKTRRFCSACRLRKCFSMGMRKDMILDKAERQHRLALLESTKAKKLERQQHLQREQAEQQLQPVAVSQPPAAAASQSSAASACAAGDAATITVSAAVDGDLQLRAASVVPTEVPDIAYGLAECKPLAQAAAQGCSSATSAGPIPPAPDPATAAAAAAAVASPTGYPLLLSPMPASSLLSYLVYKPMVALPDPGGMDCSTSWQLVTLLSSADNCSQPLIGTASDSHHAPASSGMTCQGNCSDETGATGSRVPTLSPVDFPHPVNSLRLLYPGSRDAQPIRHRITSEQSAAIARLHSAYVTTLGSLPVKEYNLSTNRTDLEMTINYTEVHVRRVVKFAKAIPEFTSASEAVQHSLLKNAFIPSSLLLSVASYEPDSDSWLDSSGSRLRVSDVFDGWMATLDPQAGQRHRDLVNSFKRLVPDDVSSGKSDVSVFALLQAIALLSPEHAASASGVCQREAATDVSDAQQRYVGLLSSYLQGTVSYTAASEAVPMLMQRLTKVKQHAAEKLRLVATTCDRSRVEPLLREVYNLHL